MKKLKSNKGVTLLVLAITIVIILILSVSVSENIRPYIEAKREKNIEADIAQLEEKISIYYSKNKSFPIANEYAAVVGLATSSEDSGKYYVIDLSLLDNLDLKYGEDNQKIVEDNDKDFVITNSIDYPDVYIINGKTGNIYYIDR
jgi:Tfp pilus assembly protein PilE